jgi:hypothetical protein
MDVESVSEHYIEVEILPRLMLSHVDLTPKPQQDNDVKICLRFIRIVPEGSRL